MGSGTLPYFLVAPTIIIIALVAVYPILDSIRLSLLDNPLVPSGATFVGLRNYLRGLCRRYADESNISRPRPGTHGHSDSFRISDHCLREYLGNDV